MNQKILVVGQSGRGKTTFAKKLIAERAQDYCVVYDHEAEFTDNEGFVSTSDLRIAMQKPQNKCFSFRPLDGEEPISETFPPWLTGFTHRWERVHAYTSKRCLLVLDEVSTVVRSYSYQPDVAHTVERSRRRGVDYLFLAHRITSIHPSIREQITKIYQFRAHDPATLRFLADYVEDIEAVRSLPDYTPLEIDIA